ncbi:MAG: phosphoribosyl-ATP diphosphatase [Candidatus Hydrothermarchaeales archaeon]
MEILEELYEIILERKNNPREGSYVSSLMHGGEEKILEKVEEEAGEVIEAAKTGSRDELVHEVADLLFHTLVLLGYKGIAPVEIQDELKRRRG